MSNSKNHYSTDAKLTASLASTDRYLRSPDMGMFVLKIQVLSLLENLGSCHCTRLQFSERQAKPLDKYNPEGSSACF